MRSSSLQWLVAVELILALLTVFLFLTTWNEGGLAGLVIIFPIFGMAAIGLVAFLVFVLQVFGSTGEKRTAKSKLLRLGGLCIFGPPVYYVVLMSTADQPLLARSLLVFMIMLAMHILIDDKLGDWKKPYEILLLLFAPFLSLVFAFSFTLPGDSGLAVIVLVIGFGIFGLGFAKTASRIPNKLGDTVSTVLSGTAAAVVVFWLASWLHAAYGTSVEVVEHSVEYSRPPIILEKSGAEIEIAEPSCRQKGEPPRISQSNSVVPLCDE